MCQLDRIRSLRGKIYEIARKHKADKVYVFGSCARMEEMPDSDVDFIAEFQPHSSLFDLGGLQYDLQKLLGCKVDLIPEDSLREDNFAANVRKDMVLLPLNKWKANEQ